MAVRAHTEAAAGGPVLAGRSGGRPRSLRAGGAFSRRQARTGFSLLEVVLSLGLVILLMATVFGFYFNSLRTRDMGQKIAVRAMSARSMLERMAEEIRHTTEIMPGDGRGFQGKHNEITIVCNVLPDKDASYIAFDRNSGGQAPSQTDLRRITYRLQYDEELKDDEGNAVCHGLVRVMEKLFNPNPTYVRSDDETVSEDAVEQPGQMPMEPPDFDPEVKFLRLQYFDGARWLDEWQTSKANDNSGANGPPTGAGGSDYALPQAIKITIGQKPVPREEDELDITQLKETREREENEEYHPDRFTIIVPLMAADKTLMSSRKYGVKSEMSEQEGL